MLHPSASRAINKRALVAFIAVLAGVVAIASVAMLILQRQHLRNEALVELDTEMGLLGELSTDALLRSDYAAVEGLVDRWVERHEYIMHITATMPNGFVLIDRKKETKVIDPLVVNKPVHFNGRTLMTIHTVGDFSFSESGFSSIIIRISILVMAMVFLLGWTLWWVLQRTAIRPLEAQILSRQEKERELTQRTVELEYALKELESFSYSVSHDLRGPLRAIDGFSHLLTVDYADKLDTNGLDYIQKTRAAAQRMGLLIDDLLALSRMSRHEMKMEEVDLSSLVRETFSRLGHSDPARKIETIVPDEIHAKGDAGLLSIVFENLLQNAWKYTAHADLPVIEFGEIREEDGEVVYYVRDNGVGFDMRYADKLFKPFQRLHTAEQFSGSGIGLATVARIVHRHGGRVWAEGETGKGATFRFTLAHGKSLEKKIAGR